MIVVEGPDGAGKTTLVLEIMEKRTLRLAPKAVSSNQERLTDVGEYTEGYLTKGFQKLLFDRFALISGPIYGALKPHPINQIFEDRLWHFQMEALFLAMKPVVIYCLPPLEVVRANLERDSESSKVVGDRVEQLYYMYQARAARDFAVGIAAVYDYTASDLRTVLARIDLRLKAYERVQDGYM